ncbi:hypothetical protein EVAR_28531_1 [Eumeta japonica]|uniref:Uncharacterized protein n=1 Tax=Eumeta variegata TaxID=151549 RepID=A0A4C1UWL9_EUMVA|nr:hypothetical protein EVAR_28531_1 [Eumeta japonica]
MIVVRGRPRAPPSPLRLPPFLFVTRIKNCLEDIGVYSAGSIYEFQIEMLKFIFPSAYLDINRRAGYQLRGGESIEGMRNKELEVELFVDNANIDILCITEHWLRNGQTEPHAALPTLAIPNLIIGDNDQPCDDNRLTTSHLHWATSINTSLRSLEPVSLYHELHSTDVVFGRRRRRTSLAKTVGQISATTFELVKPVMNGDKGWSFIVKDQQQRPVKIFSLV